ncbi:tetratricopeptide repeat protein [Magnetococcales bacterium HHB-1]
MPDSSTLSNDQTQKLLDQALQALQEGLVEDAIRQVTLVRKHYPSLVTAIHIEGLAEKQRGYTSQALELLSQAVTLEPGETLYHRDLGLLLRDMDRLFPAIERFKEAIKQAPDRADNYFLLADTLMDAGRLEDAAPIFYQALKIDATLTPARINLGLCLKALGRLPEALSCFDKVIEKNPEDAQAHVDRALTLFMMERYQEAWPEYQWRFKLKQMQLYQLCLARHIAPWKGRDPRGKRFFIFAEQGYGDTLTCIRYLKRLHQEGAIITLACPKVLVPLLQSSPWIAEIYHAQKNQPAIVEHDYFASLWDLPRYYTSSPKEIPQEVPYIHVDAKISLQWRERLSHYDGFKVGLIWRGKPLHKHDPARKRSIPLKSLTPLKEISDIHFFSLQVDEDSEAKKIAQQEQSCPLQPISLQYDLTDFQQTAAAMVNMDLIITIDTAAAHLAGALNCPTWLLLPLAPDWRWSLDRSDCLWYPSMRLFRQSAPGRWTDVVSSVAQMLGFFIQQKAAELT